jgi:hypothetical protein
VRFFRKWFTSSPPRPASLSGFSESQISQGKLFATSPVTLSARPALSEAAVACLPYLHAWGVLRVPFDEKGKCFIVRIPSLAQFDVYDRAPWIVSNHGGGYTVQGGDILVPWDVAFELIGSGLLRLMTCHVYANLEGWKKARLDGTAAEFWRVRQ